MSLLFVIRPLAIRLSESGVLSLGGAADSALLGAEGSGGLGGAGMPALAGAARAAMLSDESMVDMANIEGQIKASSIRKLAELVDKHPDESLSIMRSWMNAERA